MDIIFATKNAGKLKEIREILSGFNIISMDEAGIHDDIVEDGETFEANAILKAEAVARLSGKISMSDDSGMCIDYLNGEPGVHSARYMGKDTPYSIKNSRILDMLEKVEEKERGARYVCCIAAAFPKSMNMPTITTTGIMEGRITYEQAGEGGFGYDPIFFVPEYNQTVAELNAEQKNQISHRGIALRMMNDKLNLILEEGRAQ